MEILLYKEKMEMAKSGIRGKHKLKLYRISFSHFNQQCTCTLQTYKFLSVELDRGGFLLSL